jgi:hypothetical protein
MNKFICSSVRMRVAAVDKRRINLGIFV